MTNELSSASIRPIENGFTVDLYFKDETAEDKWQTIDKTYFAETLEAAVNIILKEVPGPDPDIEKVFDPEKPVINY
jgi:hypothetical protein